MFLLTVTCKYFWCLASEKPWSDRVFVSFTTILSLCSFVWKKTKLVKLFVPSSWTRIKRHGQVNWANLNQLKLNGGFTFQPSIVYKSFVNVEKVGTGLDFRFVRYKRRIYNICEFVDYPYKSKSFIPSSHPMVQIVLENPIYYLSIYLILKIQYENWRYRKNKVIIFFWKNSRTFTCINNSLSVKMPNFFVM